MMFSEAPLIKSKHMFTYPNNSPIDVFVEHYCDIGEGLKLFITPIIIFGGNIRKTC